MNENYKNQIIDIIIDLVDISLKDKIFEDANLQITNNEKFYYHNEMKGELNLKNFDSEKKNNKLKFDNKIKIENNIENFYLISKKKSVNKNQNSENMKNDNTYCREKIKTAEKTNQTENMDAYEKLNIYINNNNFFAFKNEILKLENLREKHKLDLTFTPQCIIRKFDNKIAKNKKFEDSELRLINSYCSPYTNFQIKSFNLMNKKVIKNKKEIMNYNTLVVDKKKSSKSLGEENNFLIKNNFSKKKNLNNFKNNNNENKNLIDNSIRQSGKNLNLNYIFSEKSNDICNNPEYLLCESVNNMYINTNNSFDSSVENNKFNKDYSRKKTQNFEHKVILNESIEKLTKDNNKNFSSNTSNYSCKNVKKSNQRKKDDESKSNTKVLNLDNEQNENFYCVSIGIQTNISSDDLIIDDLNNIKLYLNKDKKNTPKQGNLCAPLSLKNSQINKKKEENKIVIENYFSLNSYRINESFLIKNTKNMDKTNTIHDCKKNILSPTRSILTNLLPNNNLDNFINNQTDNLDNFFSYNNINNSISTNTCNNNFQNYSRYGGSALSNVNEKIILSSILNGNNLNNNIDNQEKINLYKKSNYENEDLFEVKNEVAISLRNIKYSTVKEIQTDLLIVIM